MVDLTSVDRWAGVFNSHMNSLHFDTSSMEEERVVMAKKMYPSLVLLFFRAFFKNLLLHRF